MGQISNRPRNVSHWAAHPEASRGTTFLSYLENLFRIVGAGARCAAISFALAALLSAAAANMAFAETAGDPQEFELLGTWYIVVHYRDAAAEPASNPRWEDKVWIFAYRGSRLLWTEYPVVLFKDDRGRYESLASGRSIRSTGAWRPSAAQLEEIAAGLSVNPQWQRSKSLQRDPDGGFRSRGSSHPTSASAIGYSEAWEIETPAKQPIFRRIDKLSSGRSAALDGKTEYRSATGSNFAQGRAQGRAQSAEFYGSFSRDGAQTGSFVMLRSGPVEFADPKQEK